MHARSYGTCERKCPLIAFSPYYKGLGLITIECTKMPTRLPNPR